MSRKQFNEFVSHVRNLKKEGVKEASFSVEYLYNIVEAVSPAQTKPRPKVPSQKPNISFDGGDFGD